MDRRTLLSTALISSTLSSIGLATANAANGNVLYETMDVQQPVSLDKSKGEKVELRQFLGYWCPHCAHLEPSLNTWLKTLPPLVKVVRTPVAFQTQHRLLADLFYTLETFPNSMALHGKVFDAIHTSKVLKPTASQQDMIAFAQDALALEKIKFQETLTGFGVRTNAQRGQSLADAYKLESIPLLAVNGKYITGPSRVTPATNNDNTKLYPKLFEVLDGLIRQELKKG